MPSKYQKEFAEDALREGITFFRKPTTFLMGVVALKHLPNADRVEIAFAGRSNVGKSSLLNALVGSRALARTSNTPGRTQEINFFERGDGLYIVDMPGYGYARVSKSRVRAWTALIKDYLRGRASLKRVFVLIDARHGIKANDLEILKLMDETAVSYQVVLTKADKIKAADLDAMIENVGGLVSRHPAAHPFILATSAKKGTGLDALRAEIFELCNV